MHPLPDVVQFKGHRFEVYGDTLRLSKKVDPQIAIEPFALGPPLGLKNMGWLKGNGLSAEFQHHAWYGRNHGLLSRPPIPSTSLSSRVPDLRIKS
jgi:hypothetical protein